MHHTVVGDGNIGRHLAQSLQGQGHTVKHVRPAPRYRQCADIDLDVDYLSTNVVWYCLGHGSIEQSLNSPSNAALVGLALPGYLIEKMRTHKFKLVLFSSDYSGMFKAFAGEPSYYGRIKDALEQLTLDSLSDGLPLYCFRVCSLFSSEMNASFPAKVIKSFWTNLEQSRPFVFTLNKTRPTPAKWLCQILADPELLSLRPGVINLAHTSEKSILGWGIDILERSLPLSAMPLVDIPIVTKIIENSVAVKYKFKDRKRPLKGMDPSFKHPINHIIAKHDASYAAIYQAEVLAIAIKAMSRCAQFPQDKVKELIKKHLQLGRFY